MAWSAVLTSAYNSYTASVFAIDGADNRKRFEGAYSYEWGIAAPEDAPTIAAGSLTGLTGDYLAKYTYARKERQTVVCESNPSDVPAAAVSLSNQSLAVTAAAPEDEQVNCIRFYRTVANGETYYYSGEVNYCNLTWTATFEWEEDGAYIVGLPYRFTVEDENADMEACYVWELVYDNYTLEDPQNVITTPADNDLVFDDNNTDSELGTLLHTDHNRPPAEGTYVMGPTANGTVFLLKQHRAYYCKPQQPEYWPSTYYVDVCSVQYPLVCGVFYDTRPYLFDARTIYYLAGVQFADLPNLTTFRPYPQEAMAGALNANAVASVLGLGIFHVGYDGVYLFSPGDGNGTDSKITEAVDPIFRNEAIGGVPAVGDLAYSWLKWFDFKLYFGYPGGSDVYPTNVLVFDFTRKKLSYYAYPFEIVNVCDDRYAHRLLALSSTGSLLQLENPAVQNDIGVSIDWEIETKQFELQTRKHYPRWNKYDVDASAAVSATAGSYLNDALVKQHSITGDRVTRRRLLPIANGNRFSVRVAGTGPVEIYAIESE